MPVEIVRLTVVRDHGVADIICGLRRTEGIACDSVGLDSIESDLEGAIEVVVRDHDLERARELLAAAEEPVVEECVRCGRTLRDDGGWYPDGAGELHPYCGVCAERVFGPYGLQA